MQKLFYLDFFQVNVLKQYKLNLIYFSVCPLQEHFSQTKRICAYSHRFLLF